MTVEQESGMNIQRSRRPVEVMGAAVERKKRKTMKLPRALTAIVCLVCLAEAAHGQNKHSPTSQFLSYKGRAIAGYQGWFWASGEDLEKGRVITPGGLTAR
jgi:hypothetical protein